MTENYYIVVATAAPVLLLSSSITGVRLLRFPQARTEIIMNTIMATLIIIFGFGTCMSFGLSLYSLQGETEIPSTYPPIMTICLVSLFGLNFGIGLGGFLAGDPRDYARAKAFESDQPEPAAAAMDDCANPTPFQASQPSPETHRDYYRL